MNSNLVRREDVAEALYEAIRTTLTGTFTDSMSLAIAMANNLPSAEPERKWIPVTKALPDTNNDVLLQFKSNMAVGYYEDDGWSIATGEDLYSGIDDCEEKPVAWMPLPEPWRGE